MLYNKNKSSQLPPFSHPNLGAGDFHSAALMHPLSEIRIRASLYPHTRSPHQRQPQRQQVEKLESRKVGKLVSIPSTRAGCHPPVMVMAQCNNCTLQSLPLLFFSLPRRVNHHTSASFLASATQPWLHHTSASLHPPPTTHQGSARPP